jgi:hypothetical protein
MDNHQYLEQISAKPMQAAKAAKQNKFLTPTMIKLGAGLLIAIVLLVVIMSILGQSGGRTKQLTETLYTRMTLLSGNGSPLDTYGKNLYSSKLRALNGNLRSNLQSVTRDLEGLLPDLGIAGGKVSSKVTDDENKAVTELNTTLEKARLNSLLDRTFSSQISLEIAQLLAIESELLEKSKNQAFLDLLNRSSTSLEALEIEFTNFTNSN